MNIYHPLITSDKPLYRMIFFVRDFHLPFLTFVTTKKFHESHEIKHEKHEMSDLAGY